MPWVTHRNAALLTDLYQLTMAGSYFASGRDEKATFDLFVRHLPDKRNFLVACGIHDALEYLERFHFDREALEYLHSLGLFHDDFLDFLKTLRFTGEVWAPAEGDVVFAQEPLLRVTAPLIEAQIVETFLLNCVGFQTLIATKAARIHIACRGRRFVDFSPRRDHGADAALKAARAAYIGGASGTSNVLAGRVYGIPVSGTMAHSFVLAAKDELDAFRSFVENFPTASVLLIDTFDIERGAHNAVRVAGEVANQGIRLKGVRIDSGDLLDHSRRVRRILDDAGLEDVEIILSGDLDEYRIEELIDQEVPADSFGVGTQLGTSGDEPTLGVVYKLVEDASGPKMKLSTGKATLPGIKQVYRFVESNRIDRDVVALADEPGDGGEALLNQVMVGGCRANVSPSLDDIRRETLDRLAALPHRLRSLTRAATPYPVEISPALQRLVHQMGERSDPVRSAGKHPDDATADGKEGPRA